MYDNSVVTSQNDICLFCKRIPLLTCIALVIRDSPRYFSAVQLCNRQPAVTDSLVVKVHGSQPLACCKASVVKGGGKLGDLGSPSPLGSSPVLFLGAEG